MKIKDYFYSQNDKLEKEEIPLEWWLERFRNWRAGELLASDWTQLPDAPTDKEAFASYRNTLRDLTKIEDFANAELPRKPK